MLTSKREEKENENIPKKRKIDMWK